MEQLGTLAPWALVLLAIWLILWGIKQLMSVNNPVYNGIMAVLAIIAGILFLITH